MYKSKSYKNDGPSAEEKALDRFAEMMIEKIKTISSDWKKPWFTEHLPWPRNLYDHKKYDGLNALMLTLHCESNGYKVPVFGTFEKISSFNYKEREDGTRQQLTDKDGKPLPTVTVNKGEKSFPLMFTSFTVVHKDTKEKIKFEDYKKLSSDAQKNYNVYPKQKVWPVFCVEQTNMKEARPELWQKLEEMCAVKQPEKTGEQISFDPVDAMVKDGKWICPITPQHQDKAYYSITDKKIVVPEKEQFIDTESYYGTLFHEMIHSTGAEGYLNRLKPAAFGSPEYAREELVAELGAALVASSYGMEKHIKEDSASYLKNWLEQLNESPDFIKTALMDVRKASGMVTRRVDAIAAFRDAVRESKAAYDIFDAYHLQLSNKYGVQYYDKPEELEKIITPEELQEFKSKLSAYRTAYDVVGEKNKELEEQIKSTEPKEMEKQPQSKETIQPQMKMPNQSVFDNLVGYHDDFKSKHPDNLLLIRHDDLYVALKEDAFAVASSLRRISPIAKTKEGESVKWYAFDSKDLDTNLSKLIRNGHRIAISDSPELTPSVEETESVSNSEENRPRMHR